MWRKALFIIIIPFRFFLFYMYFFISFFQDLYMPASGSGKTFLFSYIYILYFMTDYHRSTWWNFRSLNAFPDKKPSDSIEVQICTTRLLREWIEYFRFFPVFCFHCKSRSLPCRCKCMLSVECICMVLLKQNRMSILFVHFSGVMIKGICAQDREFLKCSEREWLNEQGFPLQQFCRSKFVHF